MNISYLGHSLFAANFPRAAYRSHVLKELSVESNALGLWQGPPSLA